MKLTLAVVVNSYTNTYSKKHVSTCPNFKGAPIMPTRSFSQEGVLLLFPDTDPNDNLPQFEAHLTEQPKFTKFLDNLTPFMVTGKLVVQVKM